MDKVEMSLITAFPDKDNATTMTEGSSPKSKSRHRKKKDQALMLGRVE